MAPMPSKSEVFSEASRLLVLHDFDLPKAGQFLDTIHRYHGPDSEVREKLKAFGRDLQKSEVLHEKLTGYVLECHSDYFGSQECAFNQDRQHAGFDEYFQHWFYSQPDYVEKSARSYFQKWITQPDKLKIKAGEIDWRF